MSWPIRMVAGRDEAKQIGDAYFAPWYLEGGGRWVLAPEYFRDNAHRPPLVVMLPRLNALEGDSFGFCVDHRTVRNGVTGEHGWRVTGEPPNITVEPSIACGDSYHGWIRDGVISDDCEGRRF